ncbi:MAG: restriction endonuclease, partial [Acidobacteria bacterium]|nr:restriction endonuclease [Acidobacteriota bacterium]
MRIIAQRCLYGVDKNPLAVEMAKLSLWLLTLAKDKPFEFLDHAIRCGDSLVGLHSIDQLRHFSLKPDVDDAVLFKGPLDSAVDEAINLRLKLEDMPANSVDDVQRQERLLIEANEKIARLRCAADLLVAAEFWGESAKDKLERVRHAAVKSGHYVEKGPTEEFEQVAAKERRGQLMFHWPLEFPEVIVKRGGFDAFVGNPPYLGGKRIRTELGGDYGDAIKTIVLLDEKGACDLAAYFLRRAHTFLTVTGLSGFVLTNSIAQGDTRLLGPESVLENGGIIVFADPDRPWPGAAATTVSIIVTRQSNWTGHVRLSDKHVDFITSFLTAGDEFGTPFGLSIHPALASTGTSLNGEGFILSCSEAESMIRLRPTNSEVILPYLVADDLNTRPDQSPSRMVINFGEMPEQEAACFVEPFERVRELVKPQRDKHTHQIHEACFWRHWDKRPDLYEKLNALSFTLVGGRVTKHVNFASVPTGIVFSDRLVVVATDREDVLAVLQSTFHSIWVERLQTSMGQTLGYSVSKCFTTWPWPLAMGPDRVVDNKLAILGKSYSAMRSGLMRNRNEGLTKTYNRFHDPDETSTDIQKLRDLHVEMDQAVAAAYGW